MFQSLKVIKWWTMRLLNNRIQLDGDNTLMLSDTNDMPPNDLTNDHNMVPIDERNEENVTEAKHALEESPHFSVPGHSPENFLEVSNSSSSFITNSLDRPSGYVLPFKHNRGKPSNRYSPDKDDRRSKYPVSNYVSTQRLSESLKAFVHTLSSSDILGNVEEALLNPKWGQARLGGVGGFTEK